MLISDIAAGTMLIYDRFCEAERYLRKGEKEDESKKGQGYKTIRQKGFRKEILMAALFHVRHTGDPCISL